MHCRITVKLGAVLLEKKIKRMVERADMVVRDDGNCTSALQSRDPINRITTVILMLEK